MRKIKNPSFPACKKGQMFYCASAKEHYILLEESEWWHKFYCLETMQYFELDKRNLGNKLNKQSWSYT